jgi:predicted Zn-dependent protease
MSALARRTFLGGCCCSALALAACGATVNAPEGRVSPGYRPARSSEEADLWAAVDRAEADIRGSRFRIQDPALNAYLHDIACRLASDHCSDIRVYLLRSPYFNATMAPNGMMEVWSGLLLRTQNEAQLAAVIGHELGHYLERHTLQRWRDAKSKSDFATFVSIGLAAAGGGAAANLPSLLAIASIYSFSRDQEREADSIGFDLMTKAGYRPIEAARVWEQIVAEDAASKDRKERSIFLASHPAPEERMATLREKAQALTGASEDVFADRYRDELLSVRATLFQDELLLRQPDRSLALLDIMLKVTKENGEIAYFAGEIYRLRDESGDGARSRDALERAITYADCPPDAYRSLGLIHLKAGERDLARQAFQRYLALKPDAADKAMIATYL